MRSIDWKTARLSLLRRIKLDYRMARETCSSPYTYVFLTVGRGTGPRHASIFSLSLTVGRGPVPRRAFCLEQDFQDLHDFQD